MKTADVILVAMIIAAVILTIFNLVAVRAPASNVLGTTIHELSPASQIKS
jgi:hypothetical protein